MTIRFHQESKRRGAAPGAFSLVELLVVIAIIGILLSLLLPALAASRRTANTAVGLANQRGCAQATFTYAADNLDALVNPYDCKLELIQANPFYFLNPDSPMPLDRGHFVCTTTDFDAGNELAPPNWRLPAVNATLPNPGPAPALPRVGASRIWADPLWEKQYITNPAMLQDPGKPAFWAYVPPGSPAAPPLSGPPTALAGVYPNPPASGCQLFPLARDGSTPGFKDHDAAGNKVAPYKVPALGCSYSPSVIFYEGSCGGFLQPNQAYAYYGFSPTGRVMRAGNRPHPDQNMWLTDNNAMCSVATAMYHTWDLPPYRNGAMELAQGTRNAVFFDGHAATVRNIDIDAFDIDPGPNPGASTSGAPTSGGLASGATSLYAPFPMLTGPSASPPSWGSLPNPGVNPGFVGARFWDCRNSRPQGPMIPDMDNIPNMDDVDRMNYKLNALDN